MTFCIQSLITLCHYYVIIMSSLCHHYSESIHNLLLIMFLSHHLNDFLTPTQQNYSNK